MINDLIKSFNLGLLIIIGAAVLLTLGALKLYKSKKMKNPIMIISVLAIAGVLVLSIIPGAGFITNPINLNLQTQAIGDTGNNIGNGVDNVIATYQPTASYATQLEYNTTSVTGTSYYKSGGLKSGYEIIGGQAASTTAITNTEKGKYYAYWIDSSQAWVEPAYFQAGSTTNIVNKEALGNASATITSYDLVNKQASTGGVYNTSMGANGRATIQIGYQGTNKNSAMPFGGAFVVETNSTMSSITCNYKGTPLPDAGDFGVTYSLHYTDNTFRQFRLPYGFDDGTGQYEEIECQFQNGATAVGDEAPHYYSFFPANYYVSSAGDLLLDTEKTADSDTTRTGINFPTLTDYWGA